jgi:hypothetical protein
MRGVNDNDVAIEATNSRLKRVQFMGILDWVIDSY